MPLLRNWLRRYRNRRLVRPWALSAPIVVLLIALPLLRPLRHPDPRAISDDELARLATVQALVEHRTLAIDDTGFTRAPQRRSRRDGRWYSDQPPMHVGAAGAVVLGDAPLRGSLRHQPELVMYLLTLLGVTLPVAFAAGLVYRMGRLFELRPAVARRRWRWRPCSAAG